MLYAVALVTTLRVTGHDVRPLFQGIGPDSPYRWVNPPPEFAPGNVPPRPSSTDIELRATGSQSAGLVSDDSQLIINLNENAVPPHAGDNTVTIAFTPLDPAELGPLTPPMRPDGNAYRVEMTYKPSGQAVPDLTTPGNVLVIVPEPADGVLFSRDGRTWEALDSRHEAGSGGQSASITAPGYFLAGTSRPPPSPAGSDGGYDTVVVVAVVAVLAIVLAGAPYAWRRLRPRSEPAPARRPAPRPSAPRPRRRRR
jgi:hypothetical protein